MDKITLDRETFRALAIETRIQILKKIDERHQLTLTDLSKELNLAPSTVKEHIDKLVSAGLLKQIDKGMKWKYYRLTRKGRQILNPYEKRVMIILSIGILVMFVSVYSLLYKLENLIWIIPSAMAPMARETENLAVGAGNVTGDSLMKLAEEKFATTTTVITETHHVSQLPYMELIIALLSVFAVGICIGYLIKKRGFI